MAFPRPDVPSRRRCVPRAPARSEPFSPTEPTAAAQRLVHVLPAVLHVMTIVLNARIALGDALRARAARTRDAFRLEDLASLIPVPRLHAFMTESDFCSATYTGVLEQRITAFDSMPDMENPPVKEYLKRLAQYGGVSNAVFVTMLVYVDRIAAMYPSFMITTQNVHRLLAACFCVASKTHEDRHPRMSVLADVAGVTLSELVTLEATFLAMINFRAHVSVEEFTAAENVFMAEAFDTTGGLRVFRDLYRMNVSGMDSALGECDTWKSVGHVTNLEAMCNEYFQEMGQGFSAASVNSLRGDASRLLWGGSDAIWRPPAAYDTRVPDPEVALRCTWRVRDLAKAQLAFDFRAIDVNAAPGLEREVEWQVLELFGERGLLRFRKLRMLASGINVHDSDIPALAPREARPTASFAPATARALLPGFGQFVAAGTWSPCPNSGEESDGEGLVPRSDSATLWSSLPGMGMDDEEVLPSRWMHPQSSCMHPELANRMLGSDRTEDAEIAFERGRLVEGRVPMPGVPPGFEQAEQLMAERAVVKMRTRRRELARASFGLLPDSTSFMSGAEAVGWAGGSTQLATADRFQDGEMGTSNLMGTGSRDRLESVTRSDALQTWFRHEGLVNECEVALDDIIRAPAPRGSRDGGLDRRPSRGLGLLEKKRSLLPSPARGVGVGAKRRTRSRISQRDFHQMYRGDTKTFASVMSRLYRH